MPALRDVPKVPANKERPQVPTSRLPTNSSRPPKLLNNLLKNTNGHHRDYTRAQ